MGHKISHNDTGLITFFISSSDNTYDVFDLVSPSLVRSTKSSCVALYVGLNKKVAPSPFITLSAPVSNWSSELLHQISKLSNNIEYLILVLDDFYFHKKIDISLLESYLKVCRTEDIDYLRLVPLKRALLFSMIIFLKGLFSNKVIKKINPNEPYYSSLQVAIWRKDYLISLLNRRTSIWEFEHLMVNGSKHFAVSNSVLQYEHLVEKGLWLLRAPRILNNYNLRLFKLRGFDKRLIYRYKIFREFNFFIYGYSLYKFKKFLKKSISNT